MVLLFLVECFFHVFLIPESTSELHYIQSILKGRSVGVCNFSLHFLLRTMANF